MLRNVKTLLKTVINIMIWIALQITPTHKAFLQFFTCLPEKYPDRSGASVNTRNHPVNGINIRRLSNTRTPSPVPIAFRFLFINCYLLYII
ncbi:MAG: hypothetical protein QMC80_01150 [Thermoplasmatales archaeon]|nr:hypothetical protein [Thermoplasmatales archaeon]